MKNRDGTRLARVYQYQHSLQKARVLVVDLHTDRVVRQQMISSAHLPLNSAEIDFALKVVANNSMMLEQLRNEQRRRGVPVFGDLDELDVKASIFEPIVSTHRCAKERCALLSLFDASRTVFAAEPVVYFATRRAELLSAQ